MKRNLVAALVVAAAVVAGAATARAGDIIQEWANVKPPAALELKPITADPKTTALLLLDFLNPNCTNRPRCVASVPAMKKLLTEARAKGVTVVYSLAGKTTTDDIIKDIAPHGAVLYTKSVAALKGFNVIVPVDGMSSEDLYYEQASAWLLAKGTGGIGPKVTLTRSDMIKF